MKSSELRFFVLVFALVTGCGGSSTSAPTLVSIVVTPANPRIDLEANEQFTATGNYSNNSAQDITTSVTWTSSAPDVAIIISNETGSNGLATSLAAGNTMITARSGNVSGFAILTVGSATPTDNVLPITVNGSLCSSSSYLNKPCVSVTVCTAGTSTCQTIPDILLDTGSFGLRIFKQALMNVPLTQVSSGSGLLAECIQFGDGSSVWGPVQMADVILGNKTAPNVPIQVIDSTFGTVPDLCGTPDQSPTDGGYTGILGVGVFSRDCGTGCATIANNGIYYSCSKLTTGSACAGAAAPLASQVQNPVALLPTDFNNGILVKLPSVPPDGLPLVGGILVLGIGTQPNNMPPTGVTTYNTDQFSGDIVTIFNGTNYSSIIDSGSNGIFFTPPAGVLIRSCADPSWFCPLSIMTLSATNKGASGSPSGDVSFQIGNFTNLTNSTNKVFSDIGGPAPDLFDWGLPFYFGRSVFVGIDNMSSSVGTGPYFAY